MSSPRRTSRLIWLLSAAFAVAVVLLAAALLAYQRQGAMQAGEQRVLRIAGAAGAVLDRQLAGVDMTLRGAAGRLREPQAFDDPQAPGSVHMHLRHALEQNPLIRELAVVAPGGQVLAAAGPDAGVGLQWPAGLLDGGPAPPGDAMAVGDPVATPGPGGPLLMLARPAEVPGRGPVAVVAVLQVSSLGDLLPPTADAGGLTLTLERASGQLLASLPADKGPPGRLLVTPPAASGAAGASVRHGPGRLDAAPSLLATRPTQHAALWLTAGITLDAVLAGWRRDVLLVSGAASALLLLLLAGACAVQWQLVRLARARHQLNQANRDLEIANADLRAQMQARARSDAERADTQRLLALALRTTREGFWFIDRDGLTLDLNPAMCDFLGRPREELIGRSVFDFVDEENAQILRRQMELRREGKASAYEVRLRGADGALREFINNAAPLVDDQGQPVGAVGAWTDVTDLKAAERALARAKAALDEALLAMDEGFLLWDREDRVVGWNPRYLQMFPHLSGVLAEGVPRLAIQRVAARATLPAGASEDEIDRWIEWRIAQIPDAQGRGGGSFEMPLAWGPVVQVSERRTRDGGLVGVYRDVTRERQAADELARAKAAAEAASAAKSRFLAVMSHEIRTPLNAVLGMNGLLLGTPLDGEQRRYAQLIEKSGENLLAIINDILDLSRLEAGRMSLEIVDFSIAAAVADVVSMLGPRAQAQQLVLRAQLPPDLPAMLRGDPGRIRQVLFNLVGNAIKFTESGRVDVHVRASSGSAGGTMVRIEVRDTGVGIAAQDLPRMFHPFVQVDSSVARRYDGSGLGLAICRELVELMGGRIGVESTPGQGSQFWFEVEFAHGHSAGPDADAPPADLHVRSLRVLVAEDNAVNQVLIRAVLRHLGHHCDIVADGIEALRQVQAAPYDVVLMDVQMPHMDGMAAARAIRALGEPVRGIPIVAMTANVMHEDRAACAAAGMNDFVGKPIDTLQLQAVLARVGVPAAMAAAK